MPLNLFVNFLLFQLLILFNKVLSQTSLQDAYIEYENEYEEPEKMWNDLTEYPFESLLCRKCGHGIGANHIFVNQSSKYALRKYTMTILGTPTLVQVLQNPQGEQFEVLTSVLADFTRVGEAYSAASWFKHMTWTIIVCPVCGQHIGWVFDPLPNCKREKFSALILEKVLSAGFSDSLTMTTR